MQNHNYLIIKYFSQILSYFREPGFDRFCTKKSRLHCELQKIAEIDLAFSKMSLRNEKENFQNIQNTMRIFREGESF